MFVYQRVGCINLTVDRRRAADMLPDQSSWRLVASLKSVTLFWFLCDIYIIGFIVLVVRKMSSQYTLPCCWWFPYVSIFCPRPSPKKWENDPLLLQDVSAIRGSAKQVFGLRESLPNTCFKNGSSHWFISHSGVTLFNLSGNLSGIDKIW